MRRWDGDDLRPAGDAHLQRRRERDDACFRTPAAACTRCPRGWTRRATTCSMRSPTTARRGGRGASRCRPTTSRARCAWRRPPTTSASRCGRAGGRRVADQRVSAIGPDAPAPPVRHRSRRPSSRRPPTRRRSSTRPSWCGRCAASCASGCAGATASSNLTSIDDVPFGATIDTKRGEVELRSVASRTGAVQSVRLERRLVPGLVRRRDHELHAQRATGPLRAGRIGGAEASRSRASCGATGLGGSAPPAATRRPPCAARAGWSRTRVPVRARG